MALNVRVHDWFEMLELAVLEKVYNVNLEKREAIITNDPPPLIEFVVCETEMKVYQASVLGLSK